MKKVIILLVYTFMVFNLQAQVGIGNTNPDASSILDITSVDKGVLVPRINLIDVTNLTTPINTPADGLLIWNTNAGVAGGNGIGFYFFDGNLWMPIIQNHIDDADFFEEGTTSAPNNITDDIFTQGNLAIGKTTASYNLDVDENISTRTINLNNSTTSGIISGVYNNVSGNMTTIQAQRGVYNELSGTGNNWKYGVYNNITGAGNSSNRYGTFNTLINNSQTSDYGTYNNVTSSSTSNHGKYGTYNSINNSGASTNYGVYNILNGSSTRPQTGISNWIINTSPSNNLSNFGIRNTMQLSGSGSQYGIHNDLSPASGTGLKIGIRNVIDSSNDSDRYGVINYFDGTGTGNHTGISNTLRGTGTGYKYGINTFILPTAGGTHFGIYSTVLKTGGFSGFFIGNVAFGTEPYGAATPNHYILPASRGTSNQIMQTDSVGNISWVDASTFSSDDQNLTGANLTGTTLQIDIENGTSTFVDLSSLNQNHWSRTGTSLDVATVADDISFSSDQTSITFPIPGATPSSMINMFDGGFNNTDRMVISHSETYPNYGLEYEDTTDSFIFIGGGIERVEIDLLGGFPLRVYGTARAVNFQSDTTTYPDYVFETYFNGISEINKSYTFKTLDEVEVYIKNFGHLPGVKSYDVIKKAGMTIDLGETAVKNLEKIEELFLYTIELKKENELLKTEQKRMEERLKKIEALVLD